MIEKLFYETLINKCNVKSKSKLLLCISGGVDSMVMLYLFNKYKKILNLELSVLHFNHKLQNHISDDVSKFVCSYINKIGLKIYIKEIFIFDKAKELKISIEMAGRIERYKFFKLMKKQLKYEFISLAHHYQDQIETFLLHLLRGTGLKGLRGIEFNNNNLIRPMLLIHKKNILNYANIKKIPYIEDITNNNMKFLRNRIRNELIPILKTYNPKIEQKIFNLTQISKEDDILLNNLAFNIYKKFIIYNEFDFFYIINNKFKNEDISIRKRILQKLFNKLTGKTLEYYCLNSLDNWMIEEKTRTLSLPCEVIFKKENNYFLLKKNNKEIIVKPYCFYVYTTGIYDLPNKYGKLKINIINFTNKYKNAKKEEAYIELNKIIWPLTIRNKKHGDFFKPLGLLKEVSLKNWFIKKKIYKKERNFLPIIINYKKEILFIPKLGISENAKIINKEKKILHIVYKNYKK